MNFTPAERVRNLPPYLFAEIDRLKARKASEGIDVIDLGVGDPDLPTPRHIIEALNQAAQDPTNHRYPAYSGMTRFCEAAAGFMKKRFGVSLDPLKEVITLIGSKEGISNLPLAFVNPGDTVLIPSPGYPPYTSGTLFAGGRPYSMPLERKNRFLPDLSKISESVASRAKILHINYPNNPTAAVATKGFFKAVIDFANKYGIAVSHDAAYSEQYDGEPPPSILEVEGARDVAIEFHSLSKTYNMTGWRIGWAAGNSDLIAGLGKIKENCDSGVFRAVQWAGVAALEGDQRVAEEIRSVYRKRRNMMVEGLKKLGWDVASASGTFYLWVAVPKGYNSKSFATKVLDECGVVITPGVGFGEGGEGYVRFSLTCPDERLKEALERLGKI